MNKKVSVSGINAFITRIWIFDLSEQLLAHQQQWLDITTEMRQQTVNSQGRSNRHGWNSEKTVFHNPAFDSLNMVARECFKYAFKDQEFYEYETLSFGLEAWVNAHDPGGYNMMHMHPRVIMSGCFYLDVPEKSGKIVFSDPRPGAHHAPVYSHSELGSGNLTLTPKSGQLVIFPNYLEHCVETNESDSQRVSIPMNATIVQTKTIKGALHG